MFCECVVSVFYFLQNSSSLFIVCVCVCVFFGVVFATFVQFMFFFCFPLLAYTIIQRKSGTVDFNDFFCLHLLISVFVCLFINVSLFTTIATNLEFLQYDLLSVFVYCFDESNAPNAPRGGDACIWMYFFFFCKCVWSWCTCKLANRSFETKNTERRYLLF